MTPFAVRLSLIALLALGPAACSSLAPQPPAIPPEYARAVNYCMNQTRDVQGLLTLKLSGLSLEQQRAALQDNYELTPRHADWLLRMAKHIYQKDFGAEDNIPFAANVYQACLKGLQQDKQLPEKDNFSCARWSMVGADIQTLLRAKLAIEDLPQALLPYYGNTLTPESIEKSARQLAPNIADNALPRRLATACTAGALKRQADARARAEAATRAMTQNITNNVLQSITPRTASGVQR